MLKITAKFLSWIGRATGTDMNYLTKGGGWLFVGQIVSILLSLVLTLAFANLLSPEIYGTYRYLISIMSIVGIFTITGLTNSLTQSISRGFFTSMKRGFDLQKKWIFVPIFVTSFLSLYYYLQGNLVLAKCLVIVLIIFPAYKTFSLFDSYLVGKKDFKTKTLYGVLQNLINTIAPIVCLYLTDNIYVIVFVYLLTLFVPSFIFFKKTLKDSLVLSEINKAEDKNLEENSFHLSFLNGIGKIATEIDKILIFHYLGPVKLAIYSFASAPITKAEGSLLMVRDLILPKISLRTPEELKNTLPKKIFIFSLLIVPMIVLYMALSPFLFQYLLPNYMESIIYTKYLSISLIFALPILVLNQTLIAQMQKRGLYTTRVLSPAIKIALMAFLIPRFDIFGAVLSVILGSIANIFILIYLFRNMKDSILTNT